ncbi:unnamed protein product, partial [Ceratitis capitata]
TEQHRRQCLKAAGASGCPLHTNGNDTVADASSGDTSFWSSSLCSNNSSSSCSASNGASESNFSTQATAVAKRLSKRHFQWNWARHAYDLHTLCAHMNL